MAFAYNAASGFYASPSLSGVSNLIMGIAFALSFTLITFAGSELFTGNVFVITVGALSKKITFKNAISILLFCYIGNLIGASIMGAIISMSGVMSNTAGEMLEAFCLTKISLPIHQLFLRGVMCNVLVCLGTWMASKIKSDIARMTALLWVVAGFVTSGYEHSIANAGLFTMNALSNSVPPDYIQGVLKNMCFVTLGNIVGGALIVACGYWFANRRPSESN